MLVDVGGQRVEFPDSMTQEEIRHVLRRKFPAKAPEPSIDDARADTASGMTLRPFGYDTGAPLPQWMAEGLAGAGRRMTQVATLGTQGKDADADRLLNNSVPAMLGGAGVDMASMLGGGAALKGLSAAPKVGGLLARAGEAISAPRSALQAVAGGAGYGALTSGDRAEAAIGGGLGGLLGYGGARVIGALAKPKVTGDAASLVNEGMRNLTPGEMLGGSVQRLEDAAQSVPLLGDVIKSAKRRSLDDFGRTLINKSLAQIGKQLPNGMAMGREAVAYADDAISQQYDQILHGVAVQMDTPFQALKAKVDGMARNITTASGRRAYNKATSELIEDTFNNPTQTAIGDKFKSIDSALRKLYKKYQANQDIGVSEAGDALRELHIGLMDMAKRQNPAFGAALDKTDSAYAMMSRIREASSNLGAKDGLFTPTMLLQSSKKAAGKNAFARGHGLLQSVGDAAKSTLPSTVPDSGTPLRSMVGMVGAGGLGYLSPNALMGLLGGTALYTRPGQAAARSAILSRPAWAGPLRTGLDVLAPYSGLLGAAGGVQIAQ